MAFSAIDVLGVVAAAGLPARAGVHRLAVDAGTVARPSWLFFFSHAVAQVVERDYSGDNARFKARIPPHLRSEFALYVVPEPNGKGASGLME